MFVPLRFALCLHSHSTALSFQRGLLGNAFSGPLTAAHLNASIINLAGNYINSKLPDLINQNDLVIQRLFV